MVQGRIDYILVLIWITMLAFLIRNPGNMRVMSCIGSSAENRFQNKDRLIGQFNEQSSINNRLLSLCVPPGHSSMKAIDARD